jgi:hypothetical protein
MRSFLFLAPAVVLTGCLMGMGSNLGVEPASPRPNVLVAADKTPSALILAPGITDDFVIPPTGSVHQVPVHGWRQTLDAGFHSAFPAGGSGRKLELMEAELAFSPAAVGMGGTRAVVATIRFKARLLDASGSELGVVAGTAAAKEADVSPTVPAMTDNAAKAVESLYEGLTAELLAKL